MENSNRQMTPEEFWNQDDKHKDQKFYIAFCLLESLFGDFAVARDLHSHSKLNWASTAYYYSLVHSLRLICFMALGNFPKGHTELAKLYINGNIRRNGNTRRINSWLAKYIENFKSNIKITPVPFTRSNINRYFTNSNEGGSLFKNKLNKWGEILNIARDCRNDSNYEGLIIAHEHAHRSVTDVFNKLADILFKACKNIFPEIVNLFKIFVEKSPRKDYWRSFLNWRNERDGLYYFEDSLRFRILGERNGWQENNNRQINVCFDLQTGEAIVSEIMGYINELKINECIDEAFASEVLDNIKMDVFNGKNSLMQNFKVKVKQLRQKIGDNNNA